MKYSLEKNAIDSLKQAMRYFDIYAKVGEEALLKHVVLYLENAIELILKCIIWKRDKYAIFSTKSKKQVLHIEKQLLCKDELLEVLIKDQNIKTINYTQCVEIFSSLYSNNEKAIIVFQRLGKYRNAIMHFGIDVYDKKDELISCVYNAFEVLANDLYSILPKVSEFFEYNDFLDTVEPILEGSIEYIAALCISNPDRKIRTFIDFFRSALTSHSFHESLSEHCLHMDANCLDFDFNDFSIEFYRNNADEEYVMGWYSQYSSFHNATSFCDDNSQIYFVIEHTTGMTYWYTSECFLADIFEKEEYYPWHKHAQEGKCYCKELTFEILLNELIQVISRNC